MQTKKVLILVDSLKKLTKITKTYSKIPRIRGLATSSALTAVENKTLDFSSFVEKKIMMQKYWTSNLNILLQLITINLLKILLMIT